jgi:hypothetical protein
MRESARERRKRILLESEKIEEWREKHTSDMTVRDWGQKYRHRFTTWEEYEEFIHDVESLVEAARNEGSISRFLIERENAFASIPLDKIFLECERRNLPKGQTVDTETKHQIASAVGMKPGSLSKFKSGKSKVYHRISKALSDLGYHK